MGITDYRYNCAFLHTITGIAKISENKHLTGGEIFHMFMSCKSDSYHVLHDHVASFLHASSHLLVHNLHESTQRPWDVGSLLHEDAFPD